LPDHLALSATPSPSKLPCSHEFWHLEPSAAGDGSLGDYVRHIFETGYASLEPLRRTWHNRLCQFCLDGHGAATEGAAGWIHLAGDIAHLLAAAGMDRFSGGLLDYAFKTPTLRYRPESAMRLAHQLFGSRTMLVATIVASGLINSFFLVGLGPGPYRRDPLWTGADCKAFAVCGYAGARGGEPFPAHNTLCAGAPQDRANNDGGFASSQKHHCRDGYGGGVLAMVSWLGTLAPVTAQ